jgi:hypothetical protein
MHILCIEHFVVGAKLADLIELEFIEEGVLYQPVLN